MTRHKHAYYAWVNMRQRCNNKKHPEYFRYGGRGISIAAEWNSFNCFLEDMGEKPTSDLSLDRKDNNKGYSKENCRWATKTIQSYNQRVSCDSTTKVTGVCFEKQTGKWKAYIRVNDKQITLGRFLDLANAIKTRKEAETTYYGDENV